MRSGDEYFYSARFDGPVTLIQTFRATKKDRQRAYHPFRACHILKEAERHHFIEIHEMLDGTRTVNAFLFPTNFFAERVLKEINDGKLLMIPGWTWVERQRELTSPNQQKEVNHEEHVVQLLMVNREEIIFEGRNYRVLSAKSRADIEKQEQLEIVPHKEAVKTLERMVAVARSDEEKKAFIKASTMVVDAKTLLQKNGLLLARQRIVHHFVSEDTAPRFTPSQLKQKKELDWIEIQFVNEDGTPVVNEFYELKLTDGRTVNGKTDTTAGMIRVTGIPPGDCMLGFVRLTKDA